MAMKKGGEGINFVGWEWLGDSVRAVKAKSTKNYHPSKGEKLAEKHERLVKRQGE